MVIWKSVDRLREELSHIEYFRFARNSLGVDVTRGVSSIVNVILHLSDRKEWGDKDVLAKKRIHLRI